MWWLLTHSDVNGLFNLGTGRARSWNSNGRDRDLQTRVPHDRGRGNGLVHDRGLFLPRDGCAQSGGYVRARVRENVRAQPLHADVGANAGVGVNGYARVHVAARGWHCCTDADRRRLIR